MSKLFYKVVIFEVRNISCSQEEVELLLDVFKSSVKKMATTLARKAYYEMIDFRFSGAKVAAFSLKIERKPVEAPFTLKDDDLFVGTFKSGADALEIFAKLEKE